MVFSNLIKSVSRMLFGSVPAVPQKTVVPVALPADANLQELGIEVVWDDTKTESVHEQIESAELSHDDIVRRELSIINHQRGIRVSWLNTEGVRMVCVVQSPYIDARTVHARLNGGGYVMPPTIDSIRCQFENGDNITLNQLINILVSHGMLIRYINTIELAENAVLV